MKKYLLLLLCLIVSIGAQAQFSGSGSGTSTDPYLIFYPTQLAQMANFLNNPDVVFELKNNIDLTEFIEDNYPREGWAPIGVESSPFKGTLKGNGKTISGLSIDRVGTNGVGLFGCVDGARISDFVIVASTIKASAQVGIVAGTANNATFTTLKVTITDAIYGTQNVGGLVGLTSANFASCTVTGNVVGTGANVGGMVGSASTSTFNACTQRGDVTGIGHVGGICGHSSSTPTFADCKAQGLIVSTEDYTGGILGYGDFISMTNCSHFGDIQGTNYVGGVYGGNPPQTQEDYPVYKLDSSSSSDKQHSWTNTSSFVKGVINTRNINKCAVIGNITGMQKTGGLIGSYEAKQSFRYHSAEYHEYNGKIGCGSYGHSRLYRNGSQVSITSNKYYYSPTDYVDYTTLDVSDSYYSGNVTGTDNVGGLIGNKVCGELKNSYAYANVVGETNVGGLIGFVKGVTPTQGVKLNTLTIKSSAAINTTVNATRSNVGRIYGYKADEYVEIGALGTADGNLSVNNTSVVQSGVVQTITDDLQNGTSVGNAMLKLKATYVAKGWDFDEDWTVQETESYPYMRYQAAPPVIESKLVSGATTISGRSIDGGAVYLYYKDGEPQSQECGAGNTWSFTTEPLQSGAEVRLYAEKENLAPSYFATTTVGFPGSGKENDPYLIYSAADLQGVSKSGYYKVMNDIDLTSWISKNSPTKGWVSIGRSGTESTYIDGDGHKITGLWINTTEDYTGLFSNFNNGTIKNLTVEVASGKQVKGGNYTGILVGRNANGTIQNVVVRGNVKGTVNVGGVVGYSENNTLNTITYEGQVSSTTADARMGGIAGYAKSNTVSSCRVEATMNSTGANAYVGGAFGYASGSMTKTLCHTSTTTSGTGSRVGGLLGRGTVNISQSLTTGSITSTGNESYTGGLVGYAEGNISDCYSASIVTGTLYTAGLVAYSTSAINRSYAKGDATGVLNGAGVVAQLDGAAAKVQNSVAVNNQLTFTDQSSWASRVIGGYKNGAADPDNSNYALKTMQVTLNGVATKKYDDLVEGIAKAQSELQTSSFYEDLGWDMTGVWSIDEGQMYPYLLWEVDINPVVEITLDKTTALLAVGNNLTLNANIQPLAATNKRLNWTSNNTGVATVENGVVTAVAIGEATITATSTDGSNVSATCVITVVANHDEAIAELRGKIDDALAFYNNSVEGEEIGQYAAGSRAALLKVINEVRAQITDTMDEATISECSTKIAAAIAQFQSQKINAGEDTDITLLDNVIYVEPLEAGVGQQVKLSVKMKNSANIQGYQFDLYLPEGITVATDEDDFPLAELSIARTTKNKTDYFGSDFQKDGAFRVLCGSTKGYAFGGTDGEVCTIMLNISEDMEDGAYPIILKQVTTTSTDNEGFDTPYIKSTITVSAFTLGDVNGDNKVNITDFTTTANYILGREPAKFVKKAADFNSDDNVNVTDLMSLANYILSGGASASTRAMVRRKAATAADNYLYLEPVSVSRGGQAVLSVKMKNTESIQGYQTDIYLPEGMTFAQDEDGFYLAEMSTARTTSAKTDYFGCDIQADGALRLLCGSTKGYTFSGTDGEVARVTINIPESVTLGDHTLMLKNSTVTNNSNMGFDAEPRECTVTVTEAGEETYEEGYSLTIADFSMDVDGDFEASVMLENEDAVKMIEFDMVLPEGLTIENEEGEYFINLGSRVTSSTVRNQFNGWGEENADGSIHFTAKFNRTTSTYVFTGNEGEALTLLFLADGLTDGYYQVQLKNILLNGDLKVAPSVINVKVGNPAESTDVTLEDGTSYVGGINKDCTTLTYTRTFNNTGWQAFYVPFQMSYEDWCDDFEVAKVNNFHQFDTDDDGEFDDLRMEIIKVKSGTLKQNHPYLIKAKTTGDKSITLSNATLYAAEENSFVCNSMETTYTFTGTYDGISGADMYNEKYYSMGGGSLILAEDATANLKPYRWYLKMEGRDGQVIPTPSSVSVMVWDEETNSIETFSFDNAPTTCYSIDGRMVTTAKAKGLYITNGKKVLR